MTDTAIDEPIDLWPTERPYLRAGKYAARRMGAELPDDGFVDEVAVARRMAGLHCRITPREAVVVVAEAAARGYSDTKIGSLLGIERDSVVKIRSRHGLTLAAPNEWSAA